MCAKSIWKSSKIVKILARDETHMEAASRAKIRDERNIVLPQVKSCRELNYQNGNPVSNNKNANS